MPLKYKEPLKWKNKKEKVYPYMGHLEKDVFHAIVDGIPDRAEAKIIIKFNPYVSPGDTMIKKFEKEIEKGKR